MHQVAKRRLSVFSKRPSQGHLHPESLFSRLPYDIRIIVYAYLDDGADPPLGSRHKSLGFSLCCRKAKEELDEIASQRLARFSSDFEKTTGLELRITRCHGYPQSVVVEIPFTALNSHRDPLRSLVWKRDALIGLHPLLSQYLNTVQIHFISTEESTPPHSNAQEKEKFIVNMHHLLRDIGHMIDRVNHWHQLPNIDQQKRNELEEIFHENADMPYPDDPVLVKRICISWDLRDQPQALDKAGPLHGSLFHSRIFRPCQKPAHALFLFPSTRRRIARAKKAIKTWNLPPLDPYRFSVAMCYHVYNQSHLVGEMGIISPHRWHLGLATGMMGVKHMVDRREPSDDMAVWCEGLGGEIWGIEDGRKARGRYGRKDW